MDLVFELPGSLNSSFCTDIIQKFENDQRKKPGVVSGGLKPDTKKSTDLIISRFLDWEEICEILDNKLKEGLEKYIQFVNKKFQVHFDLLDKSSHTGFQIQKSGYYKFHQDSLIQYGKNRLVTFIWYLNTKDDGHTDFLFKKVKPEEGKLVMFPATWDYIHAGLKTENKYIITGWLSSDIGTVSL
jgi:hypothetical protein